jgi:transposase
LLRRAQSNSEHASSQLDKGVEVFIWPGGETFSVANDEVGIGALRRQLEPADFVILGATGGLEMPVASALAAAGLAVAIVNPRQVRDLARGSHFFSLNGVLELPRLSGRRRACG